MNFYFDYFYYRICKFFGRTEGESKALGAVVGTQIIFMAEVCLTIIHLFFTTKQIIPYAKLILWVIFLGGGIVVFIANYVKYRNKYHELDEHWKNEPRNRKIMKGYLVVLHLLLPWLLIFLLNLVSWK